MSSSIRLCALALLILCGCTESPQPPAESSSPETPESRTPPPEPSNEPLKEATTAPATNASLQPDPNPVDAQTEDPENRVSAWRGNGRNRWDAAPPVTRWGLAARSRDFSEIQWRPEHNVRWITPLENWGNSSPVVFGDHVYVSVEPTTVVALDRATSKILWERTNDYLDTLAGADLAKAKANRERV